MLAIGRMRNGIYLFSCLGDLKRFTLNFGVPQNEEELEDVAFGKGWSLLCNKVASLICGLVVPS